MEDEEVKWKIGCFSCARAVDWGEHYICISRLQRLRSEDGEDKIVEAMASLQVCIYCAARSQFDNLIFYKEVPLLELEEAGFHWFVKHLAGSTEPWALSRGKDNCSLCSSPIRIGDHYTQVEIGEETMDESGHVEVISESLFSLATTCDSCAERYMVWL